MITPKKRSFSKRGWVKSNKGTFYRHKIGNCAPHLRCTGQEAEPECPAGPAAAPMGRDRCEVRNTHQPWMGGRSREEEGSEPGTSNLRGAWQQLKG